MTAKQVYALCKNYTDLSVAGAGAIKGKNCEIQSIEPITGGNRITFAWYNGSDVLVTDTLDVMDGEDGAKGDKGDKGDTGETGATGNGIASIEKTSTVGNVDTYTITMTDGTTATFTVTNGGVNVVANPTGTASDSLTKIEIGETIYAVSGGSGGATSYTELDDKPTMNGHTIVGDMVGSDLGLVDAESGKGLSTNDFTDALKDKLDGIASGAEVNVQADWTEADSTSDAYIDHKPTLGTASAKDVPASGDASSTEVVLGSDTRLTDSRNAKDVYSWAKAENKPSYTASEVGAIPSTDKGANSGVATLDANGKVPTSQLPSYVDDVLEYASTSAFPATGETGKIYVALDTNKTYRWGGSEYVEISESLALGETSSTAYAGNKGKANADAITAIKDGVSIDSFGDVETALSDKVSKSNTAGLLKNDGTVDTTTYVSDISGKADKVASATNGNFAGLDSNGNLTDSGSKASDFLTQHQDITGKADISSIATNEPNATASQAYAAGEHFYKNGKFCTAKTAIASGATFTLGTNYTEGTVADSVHDWIDITSKVNLYTGYTAKKIVAYVEAIGNNDYMLHIEADIDSNGSPTRDDFMYIDGYKFKTVDNTANSVIRYPLWARSSNGDSLIIGFGQNGASITSGVVFTAADFKYSTTQFTGITRLYLSADILLEKL